MPLCGGSGGTLGGPRGTHALVCFFPNPSPHQDTVIHNRTFGFLTFLKMRFVVVLPVLLMLSAPVLAADSDQDNIDDRYGAAMLCWAASE